MKISYVTTYNPIDVNNWSGTIYSIGKLLQCNHNTEFIGNLKINIKKTDKYKEIIYRFFNKIYISEREIYVAQRIAEEVKSRISSDSDLIFTAPSTIPIAYLNVQKPKVLYSDSTFAEYANYFGPHISSRELARATLKHGMYLEKLALDSCSLIIYSSDWAAKSAINQYKIKSEKVHVVPFGANLMCDRNYDWVKKTATIRIRKCQPINLLFLATDWVRKGGDFAYRITKELNQRGYKTFLHVAGINNLPYKNAEYIINHGFIDKFSIHGAEQLNKLFIQSNFLILPTVRDCTPIVFSEANSFGVPCLSTDVGGIPSIIRDDINGKMFALNSGESLWCDYIINSIADKDKYVDFCVSSFNEYSTRLNWNTTRDAINKLIKDI